MAEILHTPVVPNDPNVRTDISGLETAGTYADFTEVVPGLFARQPMFDPRNMLDLKAQIEHAQSINKSEMFSPYDVSPYGRGRVEGHTELGDNSQQIRDRLINEHIYTGLGEKEFGKLTNEEREELRQAVTEQVGRSYKDLEKAVATEDELDKRDAHTAPEKLRLPESPDALDDKEDGQGEGDEEVTPKREDDPHRDSLSQLAGTIAIGATEPQIMTMGQATESLPMTMGPGGLTTAFTMGRGGITELGGVAAPGLQQSYSTRKGERIAGSEHDDHDDDNPDDGNTSAFATSPKVTDNKAILGTMGTPLDGNTGPRSLHGYTYRKVAGEAVQPQEEIDEPNERAPMTMGAGGHTSDLTMGRPAEDLTMTMGRGGITEQGGIASPALTRNQERTKGKVIDMADVASMMIDKPFSEVSEAELLSYREQARQQSLLPALKGGAVRVDGDSIAYRKGKVVSIQGDTHEIHS